MQLGAHGGQILPKAYYTGWTGGGATVQSIAYQQQF